MTLVLLLPRFLQPDWNEQLNPTDVSERLRPKPVGGGRGGGGEACLYRRSFQGDYRRAAQLLRQRASLLQVLQTVHLPLVLDAWRKTKNTLTRQRLGIFNERRGFHQIILTNISVIKR